MSEHDLLSAITPTEAVLLYGDLCVKPYGSASFDRERVPTSDNSIYGQNLLDEAMETLVAALISDGAIPTVEVKPWLIFWTSSRIHLRLLADTNRWPPGSPEARTVDWLRAQPGRTGELSAAAIALFMPERHTNVWRIAFQSLHEGLVHRGYVERKIVTRLKFMHKEQFVLSTSHHGDLARAAPLVERTHLTLRARLPEDVRRAVFKSWRHAHNVQDIDNST